MLFITSVRTHRKNLTQNTKITGSNTDTGTSRVKKANYVWNS